jgi:transcriptional regulator with XRE-family HTH domain
VVNETTKRLIARVKQIRLANKLTQEQFAERADLDPKYYQHVEAGRKPNPEMDTLLKLAKGCGMELWQLFNFEITPAVAEDPDKRGYHSLPGKGGGKPRKPKSGKQ